MLLLLLLLLAALVVQRGRPRLLARGRRVVISPAGLFLLRQDVPSDVHRWNLHALALTLNMSLAHALRDGIQLVGGPRAFAVLVEHLLLLLLLLLVRRQVSHAHAGARARHIVHPERVSLYAGTREAERDTHADGLLSVVSVWAHVGRQEARVLLVGGAKVRRVGRQAVRIVLRMLVWMVLMLLVVVVVLFSLLLCESCALRLLLLGLAPLLAELFEFWMRRKKKARGTQVSSAIAGNPRLAHGRSTGKGKRLTAGAALGAMALHDDVRVEVVEGPVALCAARPGTVIETLNLVVPPAGPLLDGIAREGHEGVGLGGLWVGEGAGPRVVAGVFGVRGPDGWGGPGQEAAGGRGAGGRGAGVAVGRAGVV